MDSIFSKVIDKEKYVKVTYKLKAQTSLREAAYELAIGQSIGNPFIRNDWETHQMFRDHSVIIQESCNELNLESNSTVTMGFPIANLDIEEDGITQLFVQIMGGQLDIDKIKGCRIEDIEFPPIFHNQYFRGPRYGIKGIREFTKIYNKPILGGIIKPKVGIDVKTLCSIVEDLAWGGVNFIKEDEIMSNPVCCPLEERLPEVLEVLKGTDIIYAVSITCDPHHLLERVDFIADMGGNGVHINIWSGLGAYKAIRDLNLPLFLFFSEKWR